jgi:hypothetical protein
LFGRLSQDNNLLSIHVARICYIPTMPLFTPETGRRARQRKAGLASARYWRERGFANLERARDARSQYAELRREWFRLTKDREHALQYYQDGLWKCDCGLRGDSTEQVVPMHCEANRIEAELYVRRKAGSHVPRK